MTTSDILVLATELKDLQKRRDIVWLLKKAKLTAKIGRSPHLTLKEQAHKNIKLLDFISLLPARSPFRVSQTLQLKSS